MKVSIVIPAFNRAFILADALQSVVDQEFHNFEILLVDDGSTDNTFDVVQRFHSHQIRYLRHDRNKGCSAAYNTGIQASTGDLIAFLDSDDVWKPEYLARAVHFMDSHPDVEAVFCDTEI